MQTWEIDIAILFVRVFINKFLSLVYHPVAAWHISPVIDWITTRIPRVGSKKSKERCNGSVAKKEQKLRFRFTATLVEAK